jgi:hypothetical protein
MTGNVSCRHLYVHNKKLYASKPMHRSISGLEFRRCPVLASFVTLAILTEIFVVSFSSSRQMAGLVSLLSHYLFTANAVLFIIQIFYHSTPHLETLMAS